MFEQLNHPKYTFLNGTHLKIMAMISMLIDHFGAFILFPWIQRQNFLNDMTFWENLYVTSRAIGRLAFPLFCFLLVEGAYHTRDIKKYLLRLGIFALISEIPFNLAKGIEWWDYQYQNVFFTLFLGLLAIALIERFDHIILKIASVAAAAYLSYLLKTDYDIIGILLIVMLYVFRNYRFLQSLAGGMFYLDYNYYGAPAFLLTYFYNGQRGRLNSKLYYWFYPAHLLLFAGIRYLISQ